MRTAWGRTALRWSVAGIGLSAGAYAAYAATAWRRYGQAPPAAGADDVDDLLARFMPTCEVASRHQVRVAAPAATTLAVACEMDLLRAPLVRAIIRARELVLGATPDPRPRPPGLLAEAQALGWGVLAEVPDREIVMGAVTQPWQANVVFRALPPDEFVAFHEPGYEKIVWTLRADPLGPGDTVFRTETRAVATDAEARVRFRRYWSIFSPGMALIRWAALAPLKREAERRARGTAKAPGVAHRSEGA